MKFYTVTKLGAHLSKTPEGYWLAEGVAVARCGTQFYHMSEVSEELEPNDDGFIAIARDPEEVFRADSIASFQGKPIVNDHPIDEVGPRNWNQLAIGIMVNPRRGPVSTGDDDVLLADLLFTSPLGIELVESGKRAVSVGYSASYEGVSRGRGRQTGIVCNHLALVDEGRCGARCTILDSGIALYSDDRSAWGDHTEGCGCDACHATVVVDRWAWLDGSVTYDAVVDYDAAEDIDWADEEWVESDHPRVSAGQAGGGEFTSGGVGVSIHKPSAALREAATRVPDSSKAWVAKRKSARDMKAAAVKALNEGHSPESVVAELKRIAATEVHGAVAEYANALIRHIADAHGVDPADHGRAEARKGPPEKGRMAKPPPQEPKPPLEPTPEEKLKQRVKEHAASVPDAEKAWVAKRNSARMMRDIAVRALEENEPPIEAIKRIQELAGREVHGAVAAYANQLIDHMAKAWATDFSNLRAYARPLDKKPDGKLPKPEPEAKPPLLPPPVKPVEPESKVPPKPQHVRDVLANRKSFWTKKEYEYHQRAWEHATPELLAALNRVTPLGQITHSTDWHAHYQPGKHAIMMNVDQTTDVWRHEYGHAIDYSPSDNGGTGRPQSERAEASRGDEAVALVTAAKGARRRKSVDPYAWEDAADKHDLTEGMMRDYAGASLKTKVALLEVLNGNTEHIMDALPSTLVAENKYPSSQINDFIGAMTHNRLGWGHQNKYYTATPHNHVVEMFAQYVALTNNKQGKLYKKLLHTIAPGCCAHFDDILAEKGGQKPAQDHTKAWDRAHEFDRASIEARNKLGKFTRPADED